MCSMQVLTIWAMARFLVRIFSRGIKWPVLSTFMSGQILRAVPKTPLAFEMRPPRMKLVKSLEKNQ